METVVTAGDRSTPGATDTVRMDLFQSIYSIQWRLPEGEGEKQPLQLVVIEGVYESYLSNEVTLDYELAHIDRVITGQCVTRLLPPTPCLSAVSVRCCCFRTRSCAGPPPCLLVFSAVCPPPSPCLLHHVPAFPLPLPPSPAPPRRPPPWPPVPPAATHPRGFTNFYVLLTLEGSFFGQSPTVHLYARPGDAQPFLSATVDASRDYTLRNGSLYVNGTGEQFACGGVRDDRSIECAYFYGGQVRGVAQCSPLGSWVAP